MERVRYKLGEGITGEVIATGSAITIPKISEEPRFLNRTSSRKRQQENDISFICVGTPSQLNGNLDLKYVRRVCEEIGSGIKKKNTYHLVVVRSTVLPGTMRNVVIPILEENSEKIKAFR